MAARRKFHARFPVDASKHEICESEANKQPEDNSLFGFIRSNVIGKDLLFNGPYGVRKGS